MPASGAAPVGEPFGGQAPPQMPQQPPPTSQPAAAPQRSDIDDEEPDADTATDTTAADAEEPDSATNAEEADAEEADAEEADAEEADAEEADDTTPDTDDPEDATEDAPDELTTASPTPDDRESEHDRAADEHEADADADTDTDTQPDGAEDPTEPGSTRQRLRSMIARANDLLDQPSKKMVDSPYAKLFRYLLGLSGTVAKRGVEGPQYDENRLRLASLARTFSGRSTLRKRAEQRAPARQVPTPPRLGPKSIGDTFGYLARLSTHIEPGDIAEQLRDRARRIQRNLQGE